jgi:predicted metal-dependent peptidase
MANRRTKTKNQGEIEQERIAGNLRAAEGAFENLRGSTYFFSRRSASSPLQTLLRPLAAEFSLVTRPGTTFEKVSGFGALEPNSKALFLNVRCGYSLKLDDWQYVITHLLLHLGLDHWGGDAADRAAQEIEVDNLIARLDLVVAPAAYTLPNLETWQDDALVLAQSFRAGQNFSKFSMAGPGQPDLIGLWEPNSFVPRFAEGLDALLLLRAQSLRPQIRRGDQSLAEEARRYIINHYPLLAGMAASIKIISDSTIVRREGVEAAAVNPRLGEIYLAVDPRYTLREMVFLLGHELLHLGLRHADRAAGRDPLLWNYACDFKCNQYLVEMGVGAMPAFGGLYDPALARESAEGIYDLLISGKRPTKNLRSYAGLGQGDIILHGPRTVLRGDVSTLEDLYTAALRQGREICLLRGFTRGLIPAQLEEEINALDVAPISWEVALAQWFEKFVPVPAPIRTYARASRRQSATPDIPRPRYWLPERLQHQATFGVILDSSGSMDRQMLAEGLGAIASYAASRNVRYVRLVHCDAMPYDDGYVDIESLRLRYTVKGRGGTVLGSAVDYLLAQPDFPSQAPILLISDGQIESDLSPIPRAHAWILPTADWAVAPQTGGEVFRLLHGQASEKSPKP